MSLARARSQGPSSQNSSRRREADACRPQGAGGAICGQRPADPCPLSVPCVSSVSFEHKIPRHRLARFLRVVDDIKRNPIADIEHRQPRLLDIALMEKYVL